jgi:serine protease Do
MITNLPSGAKSCARLVGCAAALAILPGLRCIAAGAASPLEIAQQLNEAFVQVAETVSPAVVVIEVAQRPNTSRFHRDHPLWELLPPEYRRQLEEEWEKESKEPPPRRDPRFDGSGSGLVIRGDGYILTNTHVVEEAEKIKIRFKDGREFESTNVWTDPQSDIAVVKIDAKGLATAKLGDSARARVGEFAIAIGAPFVLDYSVTFGHVSAKGRQQIIPSLGRDSLGAKMDQDFIQTDASINPGNSGGPLVNIRGEVIGINTLVRGLGTGIGFAVPINRAKDVAEQLIAHGKVARAWLGIATGPLRESRLRTQVEDLQNGLVVDLIQTNGPAFKSELKRFDIIKAVEGQPVSNVQELRDAIRTKKIGSTIVLDIVRLDDPGGRKDLQIKVKTEAWPDEEISMVRRDRNADPDSTAALGLTVQTVTEALAKAFEVTKVEGVIVIGVQPNTSAALVGFKPGDIITHVGQKKVKTSRQFHEEIEAAGSKEVTIHFVSNGVAESRMIKGRSK